MAGDRAGVGDDPGPGALERLHDAGGLRFVAYGAAGGDPELDIFGHLLDGEQRGVGLHFLERGVRAAEMDEVEFPVLGGTEVRVDRGDVAWAGSDGFARRFAGEGLL